MGNQVSSGMVCGEACEDGTSLACCAHERETIQQVKDVESDIIFTDRTEGTQIGILVSLVRARKQGELDLYLKKEPSSVHCTDACGNTALHYAVLCRNYEAAKLLVMAGVDVDASSDDGKTASAIAAEIPDSRMLKLLLNFRKTLQRESHGHGSPGPDSLPRRVPKLSKDTVITPHLSGKMETAYSQYYSKVDTKNRKDFVDNYEKNVNTERINSITPATKVRILELQAENNAKITEERNKALRNSWDDPNTHSYMLVKSGAASSKPQEFLTRRTPWGGFAHLDQRENDIIGAMTIKTKADRAIDTLSGSNQLTVNERPHQILRDKVGLSESNKARDPKSIIPYNRRRNWSSKGLPTPPGMHKPETEFTTGARRFAP